MPDTARIKANVGSMIDQGAQEAEIETYLASEGVGPQDLRGARMSPQAESIYLALARDPHSTAESLQGFVRAQGFDLSDKDAADFIDARRRNPQVGGAVSYLEPQANSSTYAGNAPPSASAPNSTLQNIRGAAGDFADGVIPGASGFLSGAAGAIGNAAGAAFGDETFDPGKAYTDGDHEQDRVQGQFDTEHPNLATAASIAGFGAGMLALPGAGFAKGAGLAAHMAEGAVTGAGYGALSGVLNDSGDGRLANAANGALFGGALGGAAAPVARRIGDTIATARRNIPGVNGVLTGLENLPRRIAGQPLVPASAAASAQAERVMSREMQGTHIETEMGGGTVPATPGTIAAELGRRGALSVPAMAADLTEPLRDMTASALKGGGTAASRARGVLSARQAESGSRVRQHVQAELGSAVDPIAEVEAIRRRAALASGPGYRAAYAQPMVVTPEIEGIMRTPAFRNALPQAVENIGNSMGSPQALGFRLHDDGTIASLDGLSTEGFDQVIRAMRDSGRAAADINPVTGRVTNNTNSIHINDRARDLRGALSAQNPAYREVTENYADEMALKEALQRGGEVAKLSGPEIDAQRRATPALAHEAWSVGARSALADIATQASLRPGANVAQAVRQPLGLSGAGALSAVGDEAKQRAIESMAGNPGVLSRLDERLEAESQATRTFAAAASPGRSGSPLGDAMGLAGPAMDVVRKASQGRIVGALSSALLHGNPQGTAAFRNGVQNRIAEVLTATAPEDIQAGMGALSQRALTDRVRRGALYRGAGKVVKLGALQAAGLSTDPVPVDPVDLSPWESRYRPEGALELPMYSRQ